MDESQDFRIVGMSASSVFLLRGRGARCTVTYAMQALDHERYPLADRHSSQSWQERFKKNSAAFKRRIRRFVDEGVDETLKTAQERRKDREKRAQEAGLETERPE